jgi:hypothetical protein
VFNGELVETSMPPAMIRSTTRARRAPGGIEMLVDPIEVPVVVVAPAT